MFRKITVACDGSPEAARALAQTIHLAKALDAELCAITVQQDLPPYATDEIVRFLLHNRNDLFVMGLHRHALHISRLWSTAYKVALDAPCSVLGVH